MRGKEDLCAKKLIELRITPAYAGKSPEYHRAFQAVRDHPRLCGEKLVRLLDNRKCLGITPAYAGKSRCC